MEPSELDDWAAEAGAALGVTLAARDVATILDLARDVAHGVARPAAPLTAYLAGVAVGGGRPLSEVIARLTETIEARSRSQAGIDDELG
jgi:hypothetical protein